MATLSITYGSTTTNLPEPSGYEVQMYDIDASTSGRAASGVMFRDVVRRNVRKVVCSWNNISNADAKVILDAVSHDSFSLTYYDPIEAGQKTITCYVGDKSLPLYWMPSTAAATWLWEKLSINFIEM